MEFIEDLNYNRFTTISKPVEVEKLPAHGTRVYLCCMNDCWHVKKQTICAKTDASVIIYHEMYVVCVCVCLIHIAKLRASICFTLKFTDTWDFLRTPRQMRRQVHLSDIHPANLLSGATRSSVRVRWGCDWWRGAEESGPEEPKIMWERCQSSGLLQSVPFTSDKTNRCHMCTKHTTPVPQSL